MQSDTGTGSAASPTQHRKQKWIGAIIFIALAGFAFLFFGLHFGRLDVRLHAGYVDEDKREALDKIEQFHERMNAGQFEEIYEDAHPALRTALSRQEWLRHMQETREQYGLYRTTKSSNTNVIMGAPVQVRVAYDSTFEKGDVTELFGFARDGDKLQLSVYGIFPGHAPSDSSSGSGRKSQ